MDFLCEFIRIPSLAGREQTAMEFLLETFRPVGDRVEEIPFPADFHKDLEYSFPIPDLRYGGRFNSRIELEGGEDGRSILFNTHADVVPPRRDQIRAFDPYLESSTVYGRGACDAKGQVATLNLLLRLIQWMGARPAGKLIIHLVVEEENGETERWA